MSEIPSLAPAVAGASSAAVQTQGTARAAPARSGLFLVSRSVYDISHGDWPMSRASGTEQRVRQRALSPGRQMSGVLTQIKLYF